MYIFLFYILHSLPQRSLTACILSLSVFFTSMKMELPGRAKLPYDGLIFFDAETCAPCMYEWWFRKLLCQPLASTLSLRYGQPCFVCRTRICCTLHSSGCGTSVPYLIGFLIDSRCPAGQCSNWHTWYDQWYNQYIEASSCCQAVVSTSDIF